MTTQWGAPLTGEQVGRLNIPWGTPCMQGDVECVIQSYFVDPHGKEEIRLPADHIAYTLLNAGWLDGRNVALWFGGDKAPDDWDGGDVFLRDGYPLEPFDDMRWGGDLSDGIIAYIAKDEAYIRMERAAGNIPATRTDTVTIAKMTEEEARDKFGKVMAPVRVLTELGLIKPEPSREERFWASQPNGGAHVTEDIKAWVREALNFDLEPKSP